MKADAPTPSSGGTATPDQGRGVVVPPRKSTNRRANGRHPPIPADPVLAIIERAARDPTVDVDKMQRLLDMRAGLAREAAERAFNEALAAAQAEMSPVSDAANVRPAAATPRWRSSTGRCGRSTRPTALR